MAVRSCEFESHSAHQLMVLYCHKLSDMSDHLLCI